MAEAEWLELESDPGLFTLLLEDFGVTGVQVEEIYDLSKPITEIVYGFIFLFHWSKAKKKSYRRSGRNSISSSIYTSSNNSSSTTSTISDSNRLFFSNLNSTVVDKCVVTTTSTSGSSSSRKRFLSGSMPQSATLMRSSLLSQSTVSDPNSSNNSNIRNSFNHLITGPVHMVKERDDIFFAHQMVQNSCATHALLSILLNRPEIDVGYMLFEFQKAISNLSPEGKGLAIGCMPHLAKAHNKHASRMTNHFKSNDGINDSNDFLDSVEDFNSESLLTLPEPREAAQTAVSMALAKLASTNSSSVTNTTAMTTTSSLSIDGNSCIANHVIMIPDTFHFVCYLPIGGYLYELDGLTPEPINHGPLQNSVDPFDWTGQCVEILKERMQEQDVRYNLMALVPDRRLALNKRMQTLKRNRDLIREIIVHMCQFDQVSKCIPRSLGSMRKIKCNSDGNLKKHTIYSPKSKKNIKSNLGSVQSNISNTFIHDRCVDNLNDDKINCDDSLLYNHLSSLNAISKSSALISANKLDIEEGMDSHVNDSDITNKVSYNNCTIQTRSATRAITNNQFLLNESQFNITSFANRKRSGSPHCLPMCSGSNDSKRPCLINKSPLLTCSLPSSSSNKFVYAESNQLDYLSFSSIKTNSNRMNRLFESIVSSNSPLLTTLGATLVATAHNVAKVLDEMDSNGFGCNESKLKDANNDYKTLTFKKCEENLIELEDNDLSTINGGYRTDNNDFDGDDGSDMRFDGDNEKTARSFDLSELEVEEKKQVFNLAPAPFLSVLERELKKVIVPSQMISLASSITSSSVSSSVVCSLLSHCPSSDGTLSSELTKPLTVQTQLGSTPTSNIETNLNYSSSITNILEFRPQTRALTRATNFKQGNIVNPSAKLSQMQFSDSLFISSKSSLLASGIGFCSDSGQNSRNISNDSFFNCDDDFISKHKCESPDCPLAFVLDSKSQLNLNVQCQSNNLSSARSDALTSRNLAHLNSPIFLDSSPNWTSLSYPHYPPLTIHELAMLWHKVDEQAKLCDHTLLEEAQKRYTYRVDSTRRVHSYEPFIQAYLNALFEYGILDERMVQSNKVTTNQRMTLAAISSVAAMNTNPINSLVTNMENTSPVFTANNSITYNASITDPKVFRGKKSPVIKFTSEPTLTTVISSNSNKPKSPQSGLSTSIFVPTKSNSNYLTCSLSTCLSFSSSSTSSPSLSPSSSSSSSTLFPCPTRTLNYPSNTVQRSLRTRSKRFPNRSLRSNTTSDKLFGQTDNRKPLSIPTIHDDTVSFNELIFNLNCPKLTKFIPNKLEQTNSDELNLLSVSLASSLSSYGGSCASSPLSSSSSKSISHKDFKQCKLESRRSLRPRAKSGRVADLDNLESEKKQSTELSNNIYSESKLLSLAATSTAPRVSLRCRNLKLV